MRSTNWTEAVETSMKLIYLHFIQTKFQQLPSMSIKLELFTHTVCVCVCVVHDCNFKVSLLKVPPPLFCTSFWQYHLMVIGSSLADKWGNSRYSSPLIANHYMTKQAALQIRHLSR